MKKSDIFWQTYLSLEKEFINVSNFIFITDEITTHEHGKEITQPCNSQLETFSPYIADLLIRCCVQIEAISKELYYDNGGTKQRGDKNLFFDEDCLKLIDIKWAIHDKRVLSKREDKKFVFCRQHCWCVWKKRKHCKRSLRCKQCVLLL